MDFNRSCFDEALMRTFVDEMASLMILFAFPDSIEERASEA